VDAATPAALLRTEAKARLSTRPLRFCRTADCEVVYFDDQGGTFEAADLTVPVFQKSTDPARPVCYCFEHTVASIEEEVAARGASDVPKRIGEKCKTGLDDCEHTNPQGSCCLGNVHQVVKAAMRAHGAGLPQVPPSGCCADGAEST
jgi:hypothetical protein